MIDRERKETMCVSCVCSYVIPTCFIRYLEMASNPGNSIRQQDIIIILRSLSANDVGRPLVWDYLTLRWNDIYI